MMDTFTSIHKILPENTPPILTEDIQQFTHDSRWVGFIQEASNLELAKFPETKLNLDSLLNEQSDPIVRSIIYIGISRYYKGIGNLLETAKALGYAHTLLNNSNANDARAFLSMEMAILLSVTGNIEYAQTLLEKIKDQTQSETLIRYAEFRYLENQMRLNVNVIPALKSSLLYFQNRNNAEAQANHWKAIGNAYRRQQDYHQAMEAYIKGMEVALQNEKNHIAIAIEHDIAMLYFHMDKLDDAISKLQSVSSESKNYYVQCVALANKGFVELKMNANAPAIASFTQALHIATEKGIYHRITGLSFYLGALYEDLGNLSLSQSFHSQGFRAGMNMVENHFPCAGDTLKAMNGYFAFQEKYKQAFASDASHDSDWEKLISQSLAKSKQIFQDLFLENTISQCDSKRDAANHLKMSERSIFDILHKAKDSNTKNEAIQRFIQKNPSLSWKEMNQLFEDELIQRAYAHNTKNIKQLAKTLNISYAGAANKVKRIKKNIHSNTYPISIRHKEAKI